MNYKIAKTMLILCSVYLIAFYIIKFFYPQFLLQTITSPTLLQLGEFMATWQGFEVIFNFLGSFFVLYLFSCASCGRFRMNKIEMVFIVSGVLLSAVFYYFLPNLYTHAITSIMFLVAWLCGGKLSYATITFVVHGFMSQFLMHIRGFETILVQLHGKLLFSIFVLSLEGYIWIILLALLFYLKEKQNGNDFSALYEQPRGKT